MAQEVSTLGARESSRAFLDAFLWQEAAADPARVAAALSSEPEEIVEKILAIKRENKTTFMEGGFRLDQSEPWVDLDWVGDAEKLGWEGTRIEAWRYEGCAIWWRALVVAPRIAQRNPWLRSVVPWKLGDHTVCGGVRHLGYGFADGVDRHAGRAVQTLNCIAVPTAADP